MEVKMRKRNKLRYLDLPQDLKKLNITQCEKLCGEIRNTLIKTVSKNGGHLASNLGVVELTMAIHRVFNSPDDKIVWDVGHQSYTHKILTGRYDRFNTIRTENGISGFTKPEESAHDAFISGHSSVSISAAYGMAQAMKLSGSDNYAVAVTGDGALTGGEVYEALNNAGKTNTNLIIIVNHNDMSISKNVGSLAKYLISVRNKRKYLKTKQAVEKVLVNTPVVGRPVAKILKGSKDSVKSKVYKMNYTNTTIFEDLGFIYLGPVDGHNLSELEEALETSKSYKRPVVVHVNTIKGKGYEPAEQNPSEFHGISKFDIMTGNPEVSSDDCYSTCFGRELVRLAAEDENICAITAAMKFGTGLQYFATEYKNRFFDVGIAEQHAVTFSAGLASMGKIPVFAVYSSFLQRAVDQLIHDVSIGKNHVVLGIDRAGVVGEDGETHHGVFDVSILMPVPNTVVYSPSCYEELKMCMKSAIYDCEGLACVRYPRGKDNTTFNKIKLNTNYSYTENDADTLLVTYGRIFDDLYKASNQLNNHGIKCDTLKITRIIPLDKSIFENTSKYKNIVFFEEGILTGGVAEHFGNMLFENGFKGNYYKKGIEGYVKQASVASILSKLGLDSVSMAEYVKQIVEQN